MKKLVALVVAVGFSLLAFSPLLAQVSPPGITKVEELKKQKVEKPQVKKVKKAKPSAKKAEVKK